MVGTMLYWIAAAAFIFAGAVALARPARILDIRARFRPIQGVDPLKERRRTGFGPKEVRICGVALLLIGAALIRILLT